MNFYNSIVVETGYLSKIMILRSMIQLGLWICFFATIAGARCEEDPGFEFASQLNCLKGRRQCEAILKHADVGGSKLGIVVTKDELSSVVVLSREGSLYPISINLSDIGHSSIRLTWDGDYNARQLSSSGLNCLDLSGISKISIPVAIEGLAHPVNSGISASAKIESSLLIYDGNDPTGQRYSVASVTLPQAEGLLEFQREWFDRHGIRGAADFSCVGALSVILRTENLQATALKLGMPSGGDVSFSPPIAREVPGQVIGAIPRVVGDNNPSDSLDETMATGGDEERRRQKILEHPATSGDLGDDEIPSSVKDWSTADDDMPVYGQAVAVF